MALSFRTLGALMLAGTSLSAQVSPRATAAGTSDFPVRPLREVPSVAWETRPGFRDFGALASAAGVIVSSNTSGKGGTFAFDAATGKLLWSARGGHLRGQPFADNDTAWFVTTAAGGTTSRLTSHVLKTGVVRWSVEEEKFGLHTAGPIAGDGLVFLNSQNGKVKPSMPRPASPPGSSPTAPSGPIARRHALFRRRRDQRRTRQGAISVRARRGKR